MCVHRSAIDILRVILASRPVWTRLKISGDGGVGASGLDENAEERRGAGEPSRGGGT